MNINIKANEQLFNRFDELSITIKLMSVIVQNDQNLPIDEIVSWNKKMTSLSEDILNLKDEVMHYCGTSTDVI